MEDNNYFKKLNSVKCKVDKKGRFNYVSWVEAWTQLKLIYPNATSKIYETAEGQPYFKVFNGVFVKVGVTINDLEHICWYPVIDFNNKEINIDKITVFELNKSLQRALAKAIALHGIGLYVFQGEDLPVIDEKEEKTVFNKNGTERSKISNSVEVLE